MVSVCVTRATRDRWNTEGSLRSGHHESQAKGSSATRTGERDAPPAAAGGDRPTGERKAGERSAGPTQGSAHRSSELLRLPRRVAIQGAFPCRPGTCSQALAGASGARRVLEDTTNLSPLKKHPWLLPHPRQGNTNGPRVALGLPEVLPVFRSSPHSIPLYPCSYRGTSATPQQGASFAFPAMLVIFKVPRPPALAQLAAKDTGLVLLPSCDCSVVGNRCPCHTFTSLRRKPLLPQPEGHLQD